MFLYYLILSSFSHGFTTSFSFSVLFGIQNPVKSLYPHLCNYRKNRPFQLVNHRQHVQRHCNCISMFYFIDISVIFLRFTWNKHLSETDVLTLNWDHTIIITKKHVTSINFYTMTILSRQLKTYWDTDLQLCMWNYPPSCLKTHLNAHSKLHVLPGNSAGFFYRTGVSLSFESWWPIRASDWQI